MTLLKNDAGDSGKNISLSGIVKHLVHRWIPLKPTPISECELTAVFLCTISIDDFESVQKAVALSTICKVQRYKLSLTFPNYFKVFMGPLIKLLWCTLYNRLFTWFYSTVISYKYSPIRERHFFVVIICLLVFCDFKGNLIPFR